ncbi:hypothetical protein SteCoe_29894 [Stentor coeruleus]|uniref:Uncharacterized protein n=1 Tax=Stentor coeruleus TaxID=5963 RepID=A0A1R2B4W0_9CILI|nr:hypothetical protein SteCoe_29894 [Stentor coeruleus]
MSKELIIKIIRISAILALTPVTIIVLIPWIPGSLFFLTVWGFFLTNCYFFIGLFIRNSKQKKKFLSRHYAILWGLNWIITLVYWSILFSIDPTPVYLRIIFHTFPIFFTAIEFPFNDAKLKRKHYKSLYFVMLAYFILYCITTLVNGEGIYPGIDFSSIFIVYVIIASIVISIIVLEIGRVIKNKITQDNKKTLRENDVEIPETKVRRYNLINSP